MLEDTSIDQETAALFSLDLHPVYGAVPEDGDFVDAGEVLGLSTDSKEVVIAPAPGIVRLVASGGARRRRLQVQIWNETRPAEGARPKLV